jgi:protein-tyrosine phosphatase
MHSEGSAAAAAAAGPRADRVHMSAEPAERKWTPSSAAHLVPVPESSDSQPRKLGAPPTCILPDLFLGDHGASRGYDQLVELGITHVLNVKGGFRTPPEPYDEQLSIRSVPLSDFGSDDLESRMPECFAVLDECRRAGGRCLVHCSQGVNRSVSVVLAWLMCSPDTFWSLADAWVHVRARRRMASPHHLYFAQLQAMERKVHGRSTPSVGMEESGIFLPPSALQAARTANASLQSDTSDQKVSIPTGSEV